MPSARSDTTNLSRRRFLAAGTATATAAIAGCARLANWIADQVLEDVNVFNETNRRVGGTIRIERPDGTAPLDESFLIDPSDADGSNESTNESDASDGDSETQGLSTYADVWSESGEYTVSLELDAPVEGESSASETITIDNPDEEMLLVPLGAEEVDAPIEFRVGEGFSDIVDE
jgi:hypothetical protein